MYDAYVRDLHNAEGVALPIIAANDHSAII